jgi:hypothetical protein
MSAANPPTRIDGTGSAPILAAQSPRRRPRRTLCDKARDARRGWHARYAAPIERALSGTAMVSRECRCSCRGVPRWRRSSTPDVADHLLAQPPSLPRERLVDVARGPSPASRAQPIEQAVAFRLLGIDRGLASTGPLSVSDALAATISELEHVRTQVPAEWKDLFVPSSRSNEPQSGRQQSWRAASPRSGNFAQDPVVPNKPISSTKPTGHLPDRLMQALRECAVLREGIRGPPARSSARSPQRSLCDVANEATS